MNFYKCDTSNRVMIKLLKEEGVNDNCGKLLIANSVEAAVEKHVPVVTFNNDVIEVEVGSMEHPMLEEHFIEWILLETSKGMQIKYLNPNDKPRAEFILRDDKAIAVYEYCNIHGLWKKEL